MRMRNVIAKNLTLAILLAVTVLVESATGDELKRKVDSLFIIASSGEVKYRDQNEPAMDSIAALGAEAVPYLIDKFTTRSARERWTIIWTLERIGSPAVPDLVQALKRRSGLVVERVCWALGDIGDTAAVGPLMDVSGHARWQVRDQAVGALGKIGHDRAEPVVIAALQDTIGHVRKSAAVAVRRLHLAGYERELVHMLGDDFYGARMSAVDALVEMDTVVVVHALIDSVFSDNRFVGYLGCSVLGKIGTDRALDLLFECTASPDPDLRAHAAVALITADPDDLCGYRREVVEKETDRLVRLKIGSAIQTADNDRR
jgi:hypothetical protein